MFHCFSRFLPGFRSLAVSSNLVRSGAEVTVKLQIRGSAPVWAKKLRQARSILYSVLRRG